ncbi:MAG: helix-turn-helix domain-containing protein [Streptosporangiaceae bacterium]|jgi:hypothetical protein
MTGNSRSRTVRIILAASRSAGFSVEFANAVLGHELIPAEDVSSPAAVRPVRGRLREGLVQAGEVRDHAVDAGEREDAEDGRGGDSQQQFAAFGLSALVRRQQRMQPVLVEIARNPGARIRDLSAVAGLTERTVQAVVADLEAAGYLTRTRTGRRTRYTVNHDSLFRHPAQDGHRVGPFLSLLAASGEDVRTPGPDSR